MITISLIGNKASIKNYKWSSSSKSLTKMLNARLDVYGPSTSDPWPDMTAAMNVVEQLGAELIERDEPPKFTEGLVY